MNILKKYIAALLAIAIILPFSSFAFAEESDIAGHWAKEEIEYLIGKNVVEGYPDGNFKPDRQISRAEFVKIINSIFGYSEVGQVEFSDVGQDDWFYEDVGKALKAGYINGYDDDTMKPDNPITREEASKIISTVFNLEEVEETSEEFKDASNIGKWAKGFVNALKEKGYLEGYPDGTFRPKSSLTRAEAMKIIVNVIKGEIEKVVDKEELKRRIMEIIVELYGKEKYYTEESWAAYADAMYAAVDVRDDAEAIQAEVNAALAELEEKYNELELEVDKEELNGRIIEIIAELFGKEADYTEESWAAYAQAINEAVAVRDDEETTQEEINAAFAKLEEKYNALELVEGN